jgi:hypothetical protein
LERLRIKLVIKTAYRKWVDFFGHQLDLTSYLIQDENEEIRPPNFHIRVLVLAVLSWGTFICIYTALFLIPSLI